MKHVILILSLFIFFSCSNNSGTKNIESNKNKSDSFKTVLKNVPNKLQKLVASYSGNLDSADENHLYWKDGTVMIYDDGIKNKPHDEMLDNPDIEDMLSQNYVKGEKWDNPPPENFEPGRIRYEPFFLKMYGHNSAEVQNKLVNVKWTDGSDQ